MGEPRDAAAPESLDLAAPISIDTEPDREAEHEGKQRDEPEKGIALCLSGGGYRASLFHTGALWRLNESGYLPQVDRVSSVSGGSITAAVLAQAWPRLGFDHRGVAKAFESEVVGPLRRLTSTTIDVGAIFWGLLTPGSINSKLARRYRKLLFGDATLQDLPADGDGPRFVINAVNIGSGALWRFSRPYMADWKIGLVETPRVLLADAVAASSAFPPVLSPATLHVNQASYTEGSRTWPLAHLQAYGKVYLSDGGVYDNLGLETAWKRHRTILVSDGGGQITAEPTAKPDWARHTIRVLQVVDNQVRSLRKRQLIASFKRREREGAYWGIRSHVADYELPDPLLVCTATAERLAAIKTRLRKMSHQDQEELINWGYAISDTGLRRWVDPTLARPASVPYPGSPIS